MTAAVPPPSRPHLAAMLRVFAHSDYHFGRSARTQLLAYIKICEDTIEQQAAMLRADLTELDDARRSRHHWGEVAGNLTLQCDRLKAENASLRALADAALSPTTDRTEPTR